MSKKDKKPGVGVGVMILKDGKVLLGKRHPDPQKADSALHGEGTWTMPGGKLDFQENVRDAAQREVLEEIGVKIERDKLKLISVTNDIADDAHFVTLGFLCKNIQGKPQTMEPDEITQWKWFPLDQLPRHIYFPSRKILKNFLGKENQF